MYRTLLWLSSISALYSAGAYYYVPGVFFRNFYTLTCSGGVGELALIFVSVLLPFICFLGSVLYAVWFFIQKRKGGIVSVSLAGMFVPLMLSIVSVFIMISGQVYRRDICEYYYPGIPVPSIPSGY
jgi:hypothetical protein